MVDILATLQQISAGDFSIVPELSPVVFFLLFFAATFVSEDAACITAGTFAAQGRVSFALALVSCFAGILVGDIALYWVGRTLGGSVSRTRFFSRLVSDESVSKASDWLNNRGAYAIFASRFVTGLRLPTYLAAGFLKTDFWRFAFYFFIASAVWTPIVVGSVAFSGTLLSQNILIAAALAFFLLKMLPRLLSWKSRRMLIGKLKRIRHWEFWPLQVFYFPVVFYVFYLGLRFRSLTLFTSANPGMPAGGGFIGESKHEIYKRLQVSDASRNYILRHVLLESWLSAEEKLRLAEDFNEENGSQFPVVLKPNAGERGNGVVIAKSREQLRRSIDEATGEYLLQEFYDGVEASVFYYRRPNEKHGQIFSITEKQFPFVNGDGKSTLEKLILRGKRSVSMAAKYFEYNREKLDLVPAECENVGLIDIGTHSRGAVFCDGGWLWSEILESKIDEICRSFDGFYFGRFDIRAESFEDLKNGRNFRIIELNGVTSESTNIYDPRYSIVDAYRILFRQWRIAFEIGAENRKLGCRPSPIYELVKLYFNRNGTRNTRDLANAVPDAAH